MSSAEQGIMRSVGIVVVLVLCHSVSACDRDTYRPTYWPDQGRYGAWVKGPFFHELRQAEQWVADQQRMQPGPRPHYQIGRNCEAIGGDPEVDVCEANFVGGVWVKGRPGEVDLAVGTARELSAYLWTVATDNLGILVLGGLILLGGGLLNAGRTNRWRGFYRPGK